jgi:hypothetical protein
MAWRPRKSFTLGKGFRINLSRRGIGWSVGIPKLFRFGVGADRRVRSSFGSGLLRHEFDHGRAEAGSGGRRSGCRGCLLLVLISALALSLFAHFSGITSSVPEYRPSSPKDRGTTGSRKSTESPNPAEKGGLRVNTKPGPRPAAAPVTASVPPVPSPAVTAATGAAEEAGAFRIPTGVRTWRSSDGRTLEGRITASDGASDTITLERIDGAVFHGVPLSRLHPEEAARVRAATAR